VKRGDIVFAPLRFQSRRAKMPAATLATPTITSDQALRIARLDAETAYRDLSRYRILLAEHDDGWHIDYELLSKTANGGGPHYVISSSTGEIIWKTYEQ